MARVTYGALITELAGSIGGITFQKNSSGNIARLKPNMPVNVSEAQQAQNIFLSQLVASWSSLSDANKTSWNDLATAHPHINEWSEEKTLNGFQWYLSCNLNLLITGQSVISTAPAWTTVDALPDFDLFASAASLLCSWVPAVNVTGYRVLIYGTPPLRQSAMKLRKSNFVLQKSDITSLSTRELKTIYESVFGVTWTDIYADANCSIIIRAKLIQELTGLAGPYTSKLIKLPYTPNIGDSYAGGIIGYILLPGDPGYDANVSHGIIAAETDQSTSIYWHATNDGLTGASSESIGDGGINTTAIISLYGAENNAAKLCNDLTLNGFTDWVLPTRNELLTLYNNRVAIGNFTANCYWTSTEFSLSQSKYILFSNGSVNIAVKNSPLYVRAIRYF